jgi:hypothetical protein
MPKLLDHGKATADAIAGPIADAGLDWAPA